MKRGSYRITTGRGLWLATFLALTVMQIGLAGQCQAGSIVTATCPCGFKTSNLMIFGGRANFQRYCAFPALCPECGQLELVNLLERVPSCRNCPGTSPVAYDDPSLLGRPGSQTIASWNIPKLGRVLLLTDGDYYCPACHQFSFRFSVAGFWD